MKENYQQMTLFLLVSISAKASIFGIRLGEKSYNIHGTN
jgi:hypothetical protein